jgi:hypothetical protein
MTKSTKTPSSEDFPKAYNITDSVSIEMLHTVMTQTLGMVMHNAVTTQRNAQILNSAATTAACARLLATVGAKLEVSQTKISPAPQDMTAQNGLGTATDPLSSRKKITR